ncbi:hypothetical protein GTQ34_15840 [Muricauda sp. JGD-17]|uniref:Uncharacterized protein n=1 Tax=Flagellimonas ochracea TaxID=2696472 RepID=A0A964WYW7_9FLAO|nr:hypothetical protein [Allomuricauda ochracea]NAY93382.1 hypothetical protein [Allomuricauda ochracea]
MLTIDDFIGTWRTVNFPGYVGNDENIITLHVSGAGLATLWKQEGQQTIIFAEGSLEIIDNNDGSFDLAIEGQAINQVYSSICGNLFIPNPSPSFISEIPEHGRRYFEKL